MLFRADEERQMLAEIVLGFAALAGDVTACPTHRERLEAIAGALERRPTDATLFYWAAATWADCGQIEPARAALARTQELGDGFLPIRAVGFEKIWSEAEFQKQYQALERQLPRVGDHAPVVYTVRGSDLIPEGIAYDERAQALYVGSIAKGEIVRVRRGEQEKFADRSDGLTYVLGLAIDPRNRRLYAVNTSALSAAAERPIRNEVIAFDLDKGREVARFTAPDAGQLNDVSIGEDGFIYVTDSQRGAVYRARISEGGALAPLVAPGSLGGANGIATGEGGALFVAHATGVARVDAKSGAIVPIANATRETIAAIDGLYWRDGILLGIQNATNPGRVIQIELDEPRTRVTRVRTLLSHHHPALNEPTTGAFAGDRLLVLANSYVGVLDETARIRDRSVLRDPVVIAVDLSRSKQEANPVPSSGLPR
jgi:hypothetical protein